MAGYYFQILVGTIILFQFQFVFCGKLVAIPIITLSINLCIYLVDVACPVSNYCFPGTCISGCTCFDGFRSSSWCTNCCDEGETALVLVWKSTLQTRAFKSH